MKIRLLILILILNIVPVFFVNASISTVAPIKVLLVPGHDNVVWGAQYGNIKEADMNLTLATKIYNILKKDKRFDVYITRDSGGYTKDFSDYYPAQKNAIIAFEQGAKKLMQGEITSGTFVVEPNAPHHTVNDDVALRLYGFNKWANENKMDAVIHVHFNDYPRTTKWTIGQYRGFTIYTPNDQLDNSKESNNLAKNIFTQLKKKYLISNWKPESSGITPDQKLIAIGANGTLSASVRSVLVEYNYIYEKKLRIKSTRLQAYTNMANLTVAGINNYFFPKK